MPLNYDQISPKNDNLHYDSEDANRVHVQWMACPINPSDINQIEGTYPLKPPLLPAIGGNEGLGRVLSVESSVKRLCPGDWVIPSVPGLGTWRQEILCNEKYFFKIDSRIPLNLAAQIHVNPCTAYRLLSSFVSLEPGSLRQSVKVYI